MRRRLFFYTILILFAGLISFFAVSFYIVRSNSLSIAENRLIEMTHIYAGLFNDSTNLTEFVSVGSDSRITVISSEGYVLADSRPLDTQENRLTRPEIQAAAEGSPAVFTRRSNTLGVDYIYYALKIESGGSFVFVRLSTSVAEINAYLYQSLPLLIILLLVLAVACFFLVRDMANQIIVPFGLIEQKLRLLLNGEYVRTPIGKNYEEINQITKGIDDIALVLQNSFDALHNEKNKLAYILDNIGDGLFVVDEHAQITLANATTQKIFSVTHDIIHKDLNYLTNKKRLIEAVTSCATYGKDALLELKLKGNIYLVAVRRLPDTNLTMAALTDVTENRENAKRREEFFTNASHELKTPLTAIKGFNDLMALNNKDENNGKYIDSISRETNRLMSLITHMLKLSELESAPQIEPIPVSLAEVAAEVQDALSAIMIEKSVKIETKGDATIMSHPEHIYELIKNLIENAVRYNHNGGKVSVIVKRKKKKVQLTVSDNGIGIAPKDQVRIFERFYRVDKSRAISRGGTGLGLSIVKHICVLYGWKLLLKSKLGVGTDVTVEFMATP